MPSSAKKIRFKRWTTFTIVLVYLLILAGGVVRCTGSGMGCPDWPKCFGQWVPPTEKSQLPDNYKEKYSHGGKIDVNFNVYKTWTEYVNRLIGVLVGFSIFLALIFSLPYYKRRPVVFYLSVLAFVLVGFQGWIGAKVVSSNLAPYMVTFHMLLALMLVGLLIYILNLVQDGPLSPKSINFYEITNIRNILIIGLILSLYQIMIGTQVRQNVDEVAKQMTFTNRELWIEKLNSLLNVHKTFAFIVFIINGWAIIQILRKINIKQIQYFSLFLGLLLTLEIISGSILVYFNLLNIIQPVHLLIASLIFGVQFYLLNKLHQIKINISNAEHSY